MKWKESRIANGQKSLEKPRFHSCGATSHNSLLARASASHAKVPVISYLFITKYRPWFHDSFVIDLSIELDYPVTTGLTLHANTSFLGKNEYLLISWCSPEFMF
ncbi:MAG: hypothetical protein M1113_01300 [Candidatus Thermoplasmatota archaeon]|nr:hypothetical protein [Candidatus Thermoplasmatota archaeon]